MDDIEQIKKWNELKESGIITEKEFEKKKKSILSGVSDKAAKELPENKLNLWRNYLNCFGKYFVVDGRASRYEYWGFTLVDLLMVIALAVVEAILGLGMALSLLYVILAIAPRITVAVRRLHDVNRRGWWLLLPMLIILMSIAFSMFASILGYAGTPINAPFKTITFILFGFAILFSYVYVFYLLCKRSKNDGNRFGAPAAEDAEKDKIAKIIIFLMVIVPFTLGLLGGILSGYNEAMKRFEGNKVLDQVEMLSDNVKVLYEGQETFQGLDNGKANNFGIVPKDMVVSSDGSRLVSPFKKDVTLKGDKNTFSILYSEVPQDICSEILQAYTGEARIKVISAVDDVCICPQDNCQMEWEFSR